MFDNIVTNNQVNFNDLEKKIYKPRPSLPASPSIRNDDGSGPS